MNHLDHKIPVEKSSGRKIFYNKRSVLKNKFDNPIKIDQKIGEQFLNQKLVKVEENPMSSANRQYRGDKKFIIPSSIFT